MAGHGHDDAGHGDGVQRDDQGNVGPGDPNRKQSFLEKLYFPEIVKGLGNTFRHMFTKSVTTDYDGTQREKYKEPTTMVGGEGKWHIPRPGYRGEHYLKKDDQGHVKCVACFMCAAACPAECIHIEGAATPADWKDRERYPKRFEIDLLRWREDLWIRSGDSIRQIRQHGDVYRQMVRVERPADDTGHPWNTRCVAQCCR